MPRYCLILEFDGGPFVGWQRQDNGVSVQGVLEQAVERFCQERVSAAAAGRTDAGVHARAMPVQIDLETAPSPEVLRDAINFHLQPMPVAILSAEIVDADFHVRFSARARHYEYVIANRRALLALDKGRVWRVPQRLDAEAMHAAARHLVGKHDFTTFRAAACQAASPVKTLSRLDVRREAERVVVSAAAPSFLHHQVRSIVGSLVEVGRGKWRPDDMKAALEARNREKCGQVAPPEGLYFLRADYDPV